MAILTCTIGQMLTLAGKNASTYRAERRRKQTAAAFGATEPVLQSRALVVDAVALCNVDDLAAKGIARRLAANIVRGFFDRWIEAVSFIEHEEVAAVFTVGRLDPRVTGGNDWHCGVGPAEKLPDFAKSLHGLKQLYVVNVAQIMHDIETRAQKAKLDLTVGDFFLPPDHPLFTEWTADFRHWRETTLAREAALERTLKPPPIDKERHRAILMQSLAIH